MRILRKRWLLFAAAGCVVMGLTAGLLASPKLSKSEVRASGAPNIAPGITFWVKDATGLQHSMTMTRELWQSNLPKLLDGLGADKMQVAGWKIERLTPSPSAGPGALGAEGQAPKPVEKPSLPEATPSTGGQGK